MSMSISLFIYVIDVIDVKLEVFTLKFRGLINTVGFYVEYYVYDLWSC